jgi:hypothetical protein
MLVVLAAQEVVSLEPGFVAVAAHDAAFCRVVPPDVALEWPGVEGIVAPKASCRTG